MSGVKSAPAPTAPGGNTAAMDKWVHANLGVHPADYPAPGAGPDANPGAPAAAPLGPAGSDKQSQAFNAALQQQLSVIDGHLAFTADHAEAAKHGPMAAKRDQVAALYQPIVKQVDPADEAKAKPAIDKALAAAQGVAGQVAQFRQAAEKAYNDWQSRQPKFDEAAKQIGEMQAWGHAKAPPLQQVVDAVKPQVDSRAYAEACTAFDALPPQLQPAFDDYQKQKAAQAQYDPARKALDPRLTAAATSTFAKLQPLQAPFGPGTADMDAAAGAKDYVKALPIATDLATKMDAYEKALAELQKQKQDYEDAHTALQPKLSQATDVPSHKSLMPMMQDIQTGRDQMEQTAQDEDFVAALAMAKDLDTRCDGYNQAVKTLDEQKKAYEDALAPVTPRVTAASQSKYKQLEPAVTEINDLQTKAAAAADAEDYTGALDQVGQLSSKLDTYEKTLKELDEKKQKYDTARSALQTKLDAVGKPPHPKLKPDEDAIAQTVTSMEAAAADENFDSALQMAGDVDGKADAYAGAVKQLEDKKKSYEDAWNKIKPRIDTMNQSRSDELAPMQQAILATVAEIDKSAQDEDYDSAIQNIETLTRELDEYDKADANQIWYITYEGKPYAGTQQELVAVKAAITAVAIQKALKPLQNLADMHAGYVKELEALNNKQYIISWVVEAVGGADFGKPKAAVAAQAASIGALQSAISSDPGSAEPAFNKAKDDVAAAGKAISDYMDALDVGGARTIAGLQLVEVSCFAIAAACGGALLAPAGSALATTMAANAASGAGFGALEEMAKQGPDVYTGKTSVGDAAINVGKAALLNGIGGALGSGAGAALKGMVVEQICKRAAIDNPIVKKKIEQFVEGAIAGVVQTIVSNSPDVIQGKTTWGQLAVLVAENMLAGGVGGILGNTLPAKRG